MTPPDLSIVRAYATRRDRCLLTRASPFVRRWQSRRSFAELRGTGRTQAADWRREARPAPRAPAAPDEGASDVRSLRPGVRGSHPSRRRLAPLQTLPPYALLLDALPEQREPWRRTRRRSLEGGERERDTRAAVTRRETDVQDRDRAFRQGFHFTMGALIALTIACCVLILLAVLAGLAFG